MPANAAIPHPNFPLVTALPASSRGVVYWATQSGAVYAVRSEDGSLLKEMFCDAGGVYTSGPSIANGYVAFGCGWQQVPGTNVQLYGLEHLRKRYFSGLFR